MGGLGLLLFIVVGIALVAVAAYYSHLQKEQRRQELAALAQRLRWSFDPHDDASHDEQYAHFEIFRRGHSRRAYNTLRGAVDVDGRAYEALMGDFTYKITTSNGKTTTTHTYNFSYLIIHLPFASTPSLLVRPEGMFDKLAGVIGFDDIDFESAEFSRRFHVKSSDKRFAYDVIDPRMMEFLMHPATPAIDIEQGQCCLSDGRRRWTTDEFLGTLGWAQQFFDHWPDHVTRSLEG